MKVRVLSPAPNTFSSGRDRHGGLVRVFCRVLHVLVQQSMHVRPLSRSPLAETVDASDLVHAPVLFAVDWKTGLPCVVVNVHEGTLAHLCSLQSTLTPLRDHLVAARLINAAARQVAPKGTQLNLRV